MIPFTQYLRPDGRKRMGGFNRPEHVEEAARKLFAEGYRFEAEVLTTGHVSITIADPRSGEDVASRLSKNGPPLLEAVDDMVLMYAKERFRDYKAGGDQRQGNFYSSTRNRDDVAVPR